MTSSTVSSSVSWEARTDGRLRPESQADPLAGRGHDGLARVDLERPVLRLDPQRAAEDDRVLVDLGHLTGLLPELAEFLDGFHIPIGKQSVSFLTILQGAFWVMVVVLVALWIGWPLAATAAELWILKTRATARDTAIAGDGAREVMARNAVA